MAENCHLSRFVPPRRQDRDRKTEVTLGLSRCPGLSRRGNTYTRVCAPLFLFLTGTSGTSGTNRSCLRVSAVPVAASNRDSRDNHRSLSGYWLCPACTPVERFHSDKPHRKGRRVRVDAGMVRDR